LPINNIAKNDLQKKMQILIFTALIFFIETTIIREFFNVMSVMGIRPSALPPVFGLMFGPFGVFGAVIGNLAADLIAGHSPYVFSLSFIANLTYGILPLLMWNAFDEIKGRPPRKVRLNSTANVVRYIVIILLNAAIAALFIGFIMQSIGISMIVSNVTLMLFLNSFVFCLVFGVPIIVFISIKKSKTLTMNERLVLIFLLSGIISGGLIGVFVTTELTYTITDPVAMWMRIYLYIAVNLLCFYTIAIVFLRYCEIKITIPVESIASIAKNFIDSEAKARKDSRMIVEKCDSLMQIVKKSEAGILAEAFKTMALDIDAYIQNITAITTENERIATELSVARQMQAEMLPNAFPIFEGKSAKEFEIDASITPARDVGGDFYDCFMIDKEHLALVIGDVSGKGIPSSLFAVVTRALINVLAKNGHAVCDIFTKVNEHLCEGNESGMFVTAWMGILEINTGRLMCVNAGHDAPLIKRAKTYFEYLDQAQATSPKLQRGTNSMLAFVPNTRYIQHEYMLKNGDTLFLYTDGVTDACNSADERYGKRRLLECLNNAQEYRPVQIIAHVKADLDDFVGSFAQFDDITMLVLQF